ncbi:MAG: glycosyltransferase family 39 protein, partial [Bdellovibrionia bacterium]
NSNSRMGGIYFNDHPFFYFWLNGWIMRALGPSAWSARILTAVFSTGCVGLVLLIGIALHSPLYGFISALFFLLTRDIILTGATVSLDPAMMFFILLSFLLWIKKKWTGVGIVAGIGLWFKTPVVLLVFPTASVISLLRGELKLEFPKIWRAFFLALTLGSLIWIILGLVAGWQLVGDYWIRQLWGTAFKGRNLGQKTDWFMFFRMVRNGFLPGLPFLFFAVIPISRKRLWKSSPVQISLVALAVIVILITPMRFKMDYYFNPAFPFLSFLAAYSILDILKRVEEHFYSAITASTSVLMAFLLSTPTSLGPEAFVALKKFVPFIQSYGSCEDSILLIPGGEPIGTSHDYRLVLNFYTGHTVDVEGCESVGTAIRKKEPQWIILSEANYKRCLTAEEKKKFSSQIKVGHQILLTDKIPRQSEVNLTPLERELKPVIDCRPQAYVQDIYHR